MSNVDYQRVILCLNVLGLYGFHSEPMALTFLGCFKNVHFILFDFHLLTHVCNSEFRNMMLYVFMVHTVHYNKLSLLKKKDWKPIALFSQSKLKGKIEVK